VRADVVQLVQEAEAVVVFLLQRLLHTHRQSLDKLDDNGVA
jgi:hypothetical protein